MKQLRKVQFPKYTKNSYKPIPEKQPNQKVGKRPKQTFLQEDKQVANTWSILLIIREMQIKTTMRYHFTPVRMLIYFGN